MLMLIMGVVHITGSVGGFDIRGRGLLGQDGFARGAIGCQALYCMVASYSRA